MSHPVHAEQEQISDVVEGEPEKAAEIDWTKPVVSRGFGRSENLSEQSIPIKQSYKAAEVAYFFRDFKRARELWLPLAQQGLADAQANLGWMYQAGLGVEADFDQATQWYEKAIKQNHPVALNNMGTIYENALGVEKDEKKAFEFYHRSAELGYRYAQYNVGLLLLEGRGVKANQERAKHWLNKAVEQGVEAANKYLVSE